MRNSHILAIVLLCLSPLLNCSNQSESYANLTVTEPTPRPEEIERRRAAEAKDFELFLEEVDQIASKFGLKSIRRVTTTKGEEVRIWVGFGEGITSVLDLKRDGDRNKAVYFPPNGKKMDLEPSYGWPNLWQGIESSDLLDLPDDTVVGSVEPFPDSRVLLIERRSPAGYRAFKYAEPCFSKAREAHKFLAAIVEIQTKFQIDLYHCENPANYSL